MEMVAYLHLAEEYENPEQEELKLEGLKSKATVSALGLAVATGVLGMTDSASAYPCYQAYYPSYTPVYYQPYNYSYYTPVYYQPYDYYYPVAYYPSYYQSYDYYYPVAYYPY